MPPRKKEADPDTLVGYVRVSTEEQASSGLGLEAQETAIRAEAARTGKRVVALFVDPGVSGGVPIEERPELMAALAMIDRREAAGLIVAKLDRLSRSAADAAGLLERSIRERWHLVACDLGVDTSTPAGEVMANVMGAFARFEKRLIGKRTSDALQAKKAGGARLGRPDRTTPDLVAAIVTKRLAGTSLRAIAEDLNARDIPTAQGGKRWYGSSVAAVLARPEALAFIAEHREVPA